MGNKKNRNKAKREAKIQRMTEISAGIRTEQMTPQGPGGDDEIHLKITYHHTFPAQYVLDTEEAEFTGRLHQAVIAHIKGNPLPSPFSSMDGTIRTTHNGTDLAIGLEWSDPGTLGVHVCLAGEVVKLPDDSWGIQVPAERRAPTMTPEGLINVVVDITESAGATRAIGTPRNQFDDQLAAAVQAFLHEQDIGSHFQWFVSNTVMTTTVNTQSIMVRLNWVENSSEMTVSVCLPEEPQHWAKEA